MEESNTLDLLIDRRNKLIDKIRAWRPDVARELVALDTAIESMKTVNSEPGSYSGYRLAIDAITAYLETRGTPAEQDEIVQALIEGGWLSQDPRRLHNVKFSISYHLRNPTKRIKKMKDKIGLYDWKDKDFA